MMDRGWHQGRRGVGWRLGRERVARAQHEPPGGRRHARPRHGRGACPQLQHRPFTYRNGHDVLLCNSDDDEDRERQHRRAMAAQRIGGGIVLPVSFSSGLRIPHDVSLLAFDDPSGRRFWIPRSPRCVSAAVAALHAAGIGRRARAGRRERNVDGRPVERGRVAKNRRQAAATHAAAPFRFPGAHTTSYGKNQA